MADFTTLILVFIAGIALGAFFFGGLWWTVQKGLQAKNPGLIFGLSLLIRTGGTLAGFVALSQGDFNRLAGCLAGFFIARAVILRLTRHLPATPSSTEKGGPL